MWRLRLLGVLPPTRRRRLPFAWMVLLRQDGRTASRMSSFGPLSGSLAVALFEPSTTASVIKPVTGDGVVACREFSVVNVIWM
jgi:hypothetical protein